MSVIISGTGVYTPPSKISNKELVESYNAYADLFNLKNKEEILKGSLEKLTHSSEEFIEKVSGIQSRYFGNDFFCNDSESHEGGGVTAREVVTARWLRPRSGLVQNP